MCVCVCGVCTHAYVCVCECGVCMHAYVCMCECGVCTYAYVCVYNIYMYNIYICTVMSTLNHFASVTVAWCYDRVHCLSKIDLSSLSTLFATLTLTSLLPTLFPSPRAGEFGIVYRAYLREWAKYPSPHLVAVKTIKGQCQVVHVSLSDGCSPLDPIL